MKTIVTYYKGVLRSQFSTHTHKEFGKEHKRILSHIRLEPTFELHAAEVITEEEFNQFILNKSDFPFIRFEDRVIVDYYNLTDAIDGKRLNADLIFMGLEKDPLIVDEQEIDWKNLKLDHVNPKYLHDCFITYVNGTNHGRISGLVVLKRTQILDANGIEVFDSINDGSQLSGCLPSMPAAGCASAGGCQKIGCGLLGILFLIGLLIWLFRCILFGDCGNSNTNQERAVKNVIHDTIYIEKNSKVDTVSYVDETTNTTVKMLSLPNVQFEKNKAKLLRSSVPQLNELVSYLLENKDIEAEIIGHTDSDGDNEANRILSKARAEKVRQYLIENGVSPSRVKATGKGESQPVTENNTAEGRAMNRRVEVKLSQLNSTKTTRTRKER